MRFKVALYLALLGLLGLGGQAFAVINASDPVPAATLLLPYFEVNLTNCDNPAGGLNTLFSVNNASATAVLAHVAVWSDQSIPVLDFDIYLTGFDVQTVNLCDVLKKGNLPVTASAGQDPTPPDAISPHGPISQDINFASCNGLLPYNNPAINPAFRAHLQAVLQGNPSPTVTTCSGGSCCYGSKTKDGILRGYVTVDTVNSCNVFFPTQMLTGYGASITFQNVLWGDVFYVNSAENFAQGETLVHIEACLTCFVPGDHTFYGRYDNATAIDRREALPTTMVARYLNGGGFTGGTDFLVWREGGTQTSAVAYSCNLNGPSQWYPLDATQVVVFDEQENPVTTETCPSGFDCGTDIVIPNEAQRVDIGTGIPTPFNFGWVWLNLQNPDFATFGPYGDDDSQMWMFTVMDASGRFSVGFNGIAIDNANTPNPIILPVN